MTDADKTRIEKAPYFHLSKNEYGKMWLMYNPDEEGRFKCWEPITGEFWNEFEKLLKPETDRWILSREKMPDVDGEYLVAGWMHYECGNVVQFQRVVTCRFNAWVKDDVGEQMTYWRPLLPMPIFKEAEDEWNESLKSKPE